MAYFARAVHSHPPFPANNAFPMGKKNPFPSIGDAAYPKHVGEDWTMDPGNMHKKIGKDRPCGSEDILAERQADRQTHRQTYYHNTSQPLPWVK